MASLFDSDEDRTESATAFRRDEFRKQGSVALSRELVGVALILGALLTLHASGSLFLDRFGILANRFFKIPAGWDIDKAKVIELGADALTAGVAMSGPLLAVVLVIAALACVAQVGWLVSWEPLTPKWERIDPVAGFGRLFSSRGLVEAVKAVLKLGLGAFVLWWFISRQTEKLPLFYSKTIGEGAVMTLKGLFDFVMVALALFLVPGVLDYLYQRFQLEKQMRMTRREAKDEVRLREGDPLMRHRIRSLQRRIASRRMMESVPKADVVVTNPTHLAVALKYDQKTMEAPRVVAKGAGLIAQKIREIARAHGIPIVENKPLARTLFRRIDVNRAVPRELYKAVAEVMTYVYRLRGFRGVPGAAAPATQ